MKTRARGFRQSHASRTGMYPWTTESRKCNRWCKYQQ